MTTERRLARAGFTLTRDYPVPPSESGPRSQRRSRSASGSAPLRIVTTYDMWLDGDHMSTSVASFDFEPTDAGTRFTHVEHGVFFDPFRADGPGREAGSRGLLDVLGHHLL